MAKLYRMIMIAAAVSALLIALGGCRSKTKPVPKTQPTVTDTVGEVPPPPPPKVEEPHDFVSPEVTAEELPADIAEANRMAQQKGWVRDAFFGYDESTLSAESQENLSTSTAWLKSHPQYNLLVEGHCDERGTEQYNLALGDRRANVVRDYLITLGLDAGRIRTVSYGEERPFDTGHTEEAWAQNRRGHLVLVGK